MSDVNEALLMCVTAAVTMEAMELTKFVGTGSCRRVVGQIHVGSLDTLLSVRGLNEENEAVGPLLESLL